ncbi:hypothetical protein FB451DRAFT_1032776 [Mycena latifolia]|nr:hypothetical protein FB451DRAFT_1032776 [Mycena latifolia]
MQENVARVEDLWFTNHGSYSKQAGILAARSSVFKDMLSIPQPETQPKIDGCPIVVLHDSALNAEYFLKAIFDSSFFEHPPAHTTFLIVAGLLRLSTKYGVEFLRQRVLLHLSTAIPSSLAAYDVKPSPSTMVSPQNEFSCLLLAHSLALTWAMPKAMYTASCRTVEEIIEGLPIAGGRVHLPPSLQRACLIARSTLAVKQNHDIFRFLRSDPVQDCRSHDACQQQRHVILHGYTSLSLVHPLIFFHSAFWPRFCAGLCGVCTRAADRTSVPRGR